MAGGTVNGKLVTLVIVDGHEVLGVTDPFLAPTPWWMDVSDISQRFPGLAVLRLVEGHSGGRGTAGGSVTYLAEQLDVRDEASRPAPLRPWHGSVRDDPLRMPWAVPGTPADDLSWAAEHVEVTGPPLQHRTWNLSSIWSIPTRKGQVWLKCVPSFMGHEPHVLRLLQGAPVPRVIAAQGHRALLETMPGRDGYDATRDEHLALVSLLVDIQLSTVGREDDLLSVGVTDRRWPALIAAASEVVARVAPRDPVLRRLLDGADERVEEIESCGLPTVLVHGDAHCGNARIGEGAGRGIWFDWGDSKVGHPLLDLGVLERPGTRHVGEIAGHWLGEWSAALPDSRPHRAWQLVRPLAALGEAVVYQGFLDRIEQSERVFHRDDVGQCLERAAALAAGA